MTAVPVLLDTTPGPVLVLGDCLAPVLTLDRDPASGLVTGPCPTCGQTVTDSTGPLGGPHRVRLAGGIAYGPGICVPCGHKVGAITTTPQQEEPPHGTDP